MPRGIYKHKTKKDYPNEIFPRGFQKGHKVFGGFKKGIVNFPDKKMPKGKNHYNWKNGEIFEGEGYIRILKPSHPKTNSIGYILRSHLVMEKMIGRPLKSKEVVHHKGTKYPMNSIENKQDDRPENLQLFTTTGKHTKFHSKFKNQE